jgi:hypothetical protein
MNRGLLIYPSDLPSNYLDRLPAKPWCRLRQAHAPKVKDWLPRHLRFVFAFHPENVLRADRGRDPVR